MKNSHGNPASLKDEYSKVIDEIDASQLPNSSNHVNMREESKDVDPSAFTHGSDKVADRDRLYNSGDSINFSETERFCIDHTAQLDAKGIRNNERMKLNQKTHSPADGE